MAGSSTLLKPATLIDTTLSARAPSGGAARGGAGRGMDSSLGAAAFFFLAAGFFFGFASAASAAGAASAADVSSAFAASASAALGFLADRGERGFFAAAGFLERGEAALALFAGGAPSASSAAFCFGAMGRMRSAREGARLSAGLKLTELRTASAASAR